MKAIVVVSYRIVPLIDTGMLFPVSRSMHVTSTVQTGADYEGKMNIRSKCAVLHQLTIITVISCTLSMFVPLFCTQLTV